MNNSVFEKMEKEIIRQILHEDQHWSYLLQNNHIIIKREFTGVGFFTYFAKIAIENQRTENASISKVGGILNEKVQVGFVLFIKNSQLDVLEGFTYDEPWPESIESYEIFRE